MRYNNAEYGKHSKEPGSVRETQRLEASCWISYEISRICKERDICRNGKSFKGHQRGGGRQKLGSLKNIDAAGNPHVLSRMRVMLTEYGKQLRRPEPEAETMCSI